MYTFLYKCHTLIKLFFKERKNELNLSSDSKPDMCLLPVQITYPNKAFISSFLKKEIIPTSQHYKDLSA